ncbi:MAG TPA: prolyl oligopeptidase family serine peptidase [Planctomycetaceae bacterium]|nr:prolyl oligopeptidase family serine peptidase [Planctomycetaceae bacterium]
MSGRIGGGFRRWVAVVGLTVLLVVPTQSSVAADPVKTSPPPPKGPKRIPPLGIEVPADRRAALQKELDAFEQEIGKLGLHQAARVHSLLPDVQIYWQAVHNALADNEFFQPREIDAAFELLREGRARAAALKSNSAPWSEARGLLVRGYRSRLDDSVQPYGLIVPPSYTTAGNDKFRLDLWFHGRGETLSEINFIRDREKNRGTFSPPDTIVLHPYGRYCNANKFAGEIDVFEAIESVKERYRIDDDRIIIRGFSMGGASTWHLAVHYPDLWAAANPGAGFAETPVFAKVFHKETLTPSWWEVKLFHWYDATDWAGNLWHCPTVAYSGEIDSQKQAADIMAEAMKKHGLELVHVIGPNTKHQYHPQARVEVDRRITQLAERGREVLPDAIRFTTYTLRYNRCGWVTVDALDRHWEQARIEVHADEGGGLMFATDNIKAFSVHVPSGYAPIRASVQKEIALQFVPAKVDTNAREPQSLQVPALTRSDRSWNFSVHRDGKQWKIGALPEALRKRHGLQGPIDDAFMEPFVFVRPTGKSTHPEVEKWVHAEFDRAVVRWRRQFRGTPRIVDDRDVTPADIESKNLILWGDAASNSVISQIAGKLPIRADGGQITAGAQQFDAAHHVPILIYPNPLNPNRYVVLNSGFTFREHADMSNALQIPMLPDWAVVDIRTPPTDDWPGKMAAADFFDEQWQLGPPHAE